MQNSLRQKIFQAIGFWIAAAAILILDLASKAWVVGSLKPVPGTELFGPPKTTVLVPGYLRFQYAENPGVAFSLFQDHPQVLTGVALVLAAAVLVWALFFLPAEERWSRLALGLIFGGAVGNLIDRFRYGYVVDFIVAHWKEHAWPTFNVADSGICVGIALFFLASLQAGRREKTKEGRD